MTRDEFAEALSRLVGEAEDGGPERPQMIAVLEEQMQAIRNRSEYQQRMLHLVEALNSGNRKKSDEFRAMQVLQDSGALNSWPWDTVRPGNPNAGEPDWVLFPRDDLKPIGLEVTQPKIDDVFLYNSAIQKLLVGRPIKSAKANKFAEQALRLVSGDQKLEQVQRAIARCPVARAANFMIKAVECKKTKPAYVEGRFSLHLVLHEPRPLFLTTDGSHLAVLEKVARAADHGSFAAIWPVDWNSNVTLLRQDGALAHYPRPKRKRVSSTTVA